MLVLEVRLCRRRDRAIPADQAGEKSASNDEIKTCLLLPLATEQATLLTLLAVSEKL